MPEQFVSIFVNMDTTSSHAHGPRDMCEALAIIHAYTNEHSLTHTDMLWVCFGPDTLAKTDNRARRNHVYKKVAHMRGVVLTR